MNYGNTGLDNFVSLSSLYNAKKYFNYYFLVDVRINLKIDYFSDVVTVRLRTTSYQ